MIIRPKGYITGKIHYKNSNLIQTIKFKNHTLDSGKKFLASCLLERAEKPIFVKNWLIGDGGTEGGIPKEVDPTMESMFGVVRLKKPVIAQIDPEVPTRVFFSMVIGYDEANDSTLNEFGLELSDGSLFSLSTFADLNKTNQMELAWGWEVCFI